MKEKEITFYLVSGSVGETAQNMLSATLTQFPNASVKEVKHFPFVEDISTLTKIMQDALTDGAILITTLVNRKLINLVNNFCQQTGLEHVDYLSQLTNLIEKRTDLEPIQVPRRLDPFNKEYFNRVEAIEFAVRFDDGKDPRGLIKADIVLLGISRTSKTPLSMYLANKKYKVANFPLIPEMPLPKELFDIPKEKIFGLTTSMDSLLQIRRMRLKTYGLNEDSSYGDLTRIQEEVNYANDIFKQLDIIPINVSNKAIEETAMLIEMKLGNASKLS